MASIFPFRGILYQRDKVGDLSRVVAPPYDVIGKEEQERLYEKHPYNIIRLILGREKPGDDERNNKYTRASNYLETWQKKGILKREERPAIYPYRQEFHLPREGIGVRKGFIALVKLGDSGEGGIFPHEEIFEEPKADRLRLLQASKANLCPIFCLYFDPLRRLEGVFDCLEANPLFEITLEDGVRHQFWSLGDKGIIDEITREIEDKALLIADGHHRYAACLAYCREEKSKLFHPTDQEPFNYAMMYLTNAEDEGLVTLPTHRVVKEIDLNKLEATLSKAFFLERLDFDSTTESEVRGKLFSQLRERGKGQHVFGVYAEGSNHYWLLTLKEKIVGNNILKRLDVTILEDLILKRSGIQGKDHVWYTNDPNEALDWAKKAKAKVAFLLNPPRISEIREAVRYGEKMPPKSTFFYPKPLSGLVIRKI